MSANNEDLQPEVLYQFDSNSIKLSVVDPGSASLREHETSIFLNSQRVRYDSGASSKEKNTYNPFSLGTSWADTLFNETLPPRLVPISVSAATPVNNLSMLPKK